ncbi:MAG: hypothetical protein LBN18_03550 [Dysgonamonadaceae bacterium]|jgi:hypothetical protein|nr:hypothetical protein [Dysgonamonadaceae bacterium]
MKKITLLFASLMLVSVSVNAQQLKNPTTDLWDIHPAIVIWNCSSSSFASSNAMEIDQTITFAVDIAGTNLLNWIQNAPAGVTRGVGVDLWVDAGIYEDAALKEAVDGKHIFMGRLDYKPIISDGTHQIYAADLNFAQTAFNHNLGAIIPYLTVEGRDVLLRANLLGYGFKTDGTNSDLEWWAESNGNHIYDEVVILTQPYTGTKKAEDFFNDDFDQVLSIGGGYTDIQGVAVPCLAPKKDLGITPVVVDSPIVGHEYYNLQGIKLPGQPESGLYIDKAIKANGTSAATKALKALK